MAFVKDGVGGTGAGGVMMGEVGELDWVTSTGLLGDYLSNDAAASFQHPFASSTLDWTTTTNTTTGVSSASSSASSPSYTTATITNSSSIPLHQQQFLQYSSTISPAVLHQSQQHSGHSSLHSSSYSSPHLYPGLALQQQQQQQMANEVVDQSLLALQMSLQAQAHVRALEAAADSIGGHGSAFYGGLGAAGAGEGSSSSPSSNGYAINRAQLLGPASSGQQYAMDPPPLATAATSSSSTAAANKSYQRVAPPLSRRNIGAGSSSSSSPSVTSSASPTASSSATATQAAVRLRQSSIAQLSPPSSHPASPRAPVDFSFSTLESDLDRFYYESSDFASAATAVIASSGTGRSLHTLTLGGSSGIAASGFNGSSSSTHTEGASPAFSDLLSEFATMPLRSLTASNAASPHDYLGMNTAPTSSATSSISNKLSPQDDPSPASSSSAATGPTPPTFFDTSTFDDLGDARGGGSAAAAALAGDASSSSSSSSSSRSDPIAAQAWRLINKAKNTLPNGARMENLTWRLMSMTLRKRREETALAEAEAAKAAAKELKREEQEQDQAARAEHQEQEEKALEEQELEEEALAPLRNQRLEEVVDRGRRGRTTPSASKSPSEPSVESPEAEEEAMDWRAKSQSRSRSRLPDAMMDWRAQSRSRSRAPDFRIPALPLPPIASYDSVTAQLNHHLLSASPTTNASAAAAASRFFGDHGGVSSSSIPTTPEVDAAQQEEEKGRVDLASALGLSPAGDYSRSYEADVLDYSLLQSGRRKSSLDLIASKETLHYLLTLSPAESGGSASSSTWSPMAENLAFAPSFDFKSMPSKPSEAYSQAQQQLHHIANQNRKASAGTNAYGIRPPYSFIPSASPSTSSPLSSSVPASGLTLARPSPSKSSSAATSSGRPTALSATRIDHAASPINLLSCSAPSQHIGGVIAPPSYFGGIGNDANSLLDYFGSTMTANSQTYFTYNFDGAASLDQHQHQPSYLSHRVPTHINPSHLSNNVSPSTSYQSNVYESEAAWAYSPYGSLGAVNTSDIGNDVGGQGGLDKADDAARAIDLPLHAFQQRPSAAPANIRSLSSPDLVGFKMSHSMPASAPISRIHSRQSTGAVEKKSSASKPSAPSGISKAALASSLLGTIDARAESDIKCLNCNTSNTPLWRRDVDGRPLCNACGLFRNLHGIDRPAALNTGVIKKRNRARTPKDAPKKSGSVARAAARRNSSGSITPTAAVRPLARTNAVPYPSTLDRANQH